MWSLLYASICGLAHAARDEPCQDSVRVHSQGQRVLLAIGDGAGHCQYSHSGQAAENATDVAIRAAKPRLTRSTLRSADYSHRALGDVFAAARSSLRAKAVFGGVEMRNFATTLTVFCAFDDIGIAGNVGDSPAVVEYENGDIELLTRPRAEGQASNVTCFLNDPMFFRHLSSVRISERILSVAVFSDGLEIAALRDGTTPHSGFFTPLFKWAAIKDELEKEARLRDFLQRDDMMRLSCDDMTIALATRRTP